MCGLEEIAQPVHPMDIQLRTGNVGNVTHCKMTLDYQIIIGMCLGTVVLMIVLILVTWCKFRNGGVYKTYEAKGADVADNPDTAIVYNHMGYPEVQRKKEFFI